MRRPAPRCPERLGHEFTFDVALAAVVRINAPDEETARTRLYETIDGAAADFGPAHDGEPLVCEATIDGEPELVEINGEVV